MLALSCVVPAGPRNPLRSLPRPGFTHGGWRQPLVWAALLGGWACSVSLLPAQSRTWTAAPDPLSQPPEFKPQQIGSIRLPAAKPGTATPPLVFSTTPSPFVLIVSPDPETPHDVWDLATLRRVGKVPGKVSAGSTHAALSPDGTQVAVVTHKSFVQCQVELWDVAAGELRQSLPISSGMSKVQWLALPRPGRVLVVRQAEQAGLVAEILDVAAAQVAQSFPLEPLANPALWDLSPAGNYLAVVDARRRLLVYALKDGQLAGTITLPAEVAGGTRAIDALRFSPDGSELAILASKAGEADWLLAWGLEKGSSTVDLRQLMIRKEAAAVPTGAPLRTALEPLPDGSAWVLQGTHLIDRNSGHLVWKWLGTAPAGTAAAPVRMLDNDHIVLTTPVEGGRTLQIVKVPWPSIDRALDALKSAQAGWLTPGQAVSVQVDVDGIRFGTPQSATDELRASLTRRLTSEHLSVQADQPVVFRLKYRETPGQPLVEDRGPFGPPRIPRFPRPFSPFRAPPRTEDPPPADREGASTGTAFVVRADGHLATCAHVVEGATEVEVLLGTRTYAAKVLGTNIAKDLALLKIDAEQLPTLPFADADQIQLGEEVRAIGFPLASLLGDSVKVTRGTLAGIVDRDAKKVFQVDASINPGNSGGPLVNDRGEVVGVNSAKIIGEAVDNVGFSVPISELQAFLKEHKLDPPPPVRGALRLDGPTLVKRASACVALVRSRSTRPPSGGGSVAAGGVRSTVIQCELACLVPGQATPVWQSEFRVDPDVVRVQGSFTEENIRRSVFKLALDRLQQVSLPYFISKDTPPVVLPGVTDLQHIGSPTIQPGNATPKATRRGMSG